jgi:hypothetical protein
VRKITQFRNWRVANISVHSTTYLWLWSKIHFKETIYLLTFLTIRLFFLESFICEKKDIIFAQIFNVKKTLFLLFSIVYLNVSGQEDVQKDRRNQHQLGVNATYFFKQFLNFGNSGSLAISPYIVSYKVFDRKHHGFRFGAGFNSTTSTKNPDSLNAQKTTVANYNFRSGYEFQKQLSEKWTCFFGVDGVFNYQFQKSTSSNGFDNVTSTNLTYSYGGGPIFGIQFNLSKHVTLFTETGIYATAGETSTKSSFENNPVFNSKSKTNNSAINFVLPTSLFLNIRF